jgi:hypothetical protein
MRRAYFLVLATLTTLLSTAAAAAEAEVNPWHPISMFGELPPLLPDDAHVFGYIAETLHLGSGSDSDLIQRLQSNSSIDHLHDYRGEVIFAVKPELLGSDGASLVHGAGGNYPFFVFRQLEHGWVLLGQMQGRGYEWSTQSRHLVFNMSVLEPNGTRTIVRYEVNPGSLENLNELARAERRNDKFLPDVRNSF